MLKSQDCVLLIKLLANGHYAELSQRELSALLCISLSEINASIKRLFQSGLIRHDIESKGIYPILSAAEEFVIVGIKYSFPAKLGEYSRGIPTGIAAPVFQGKIVMGDEPIPIWPFAHGDKKGLSVEPLYSSVPQSISEYPDQNFYDLLALVDVIRIGRARERSMAINLLKEKINQWQSIKEQ